mgnify:CR=1 FL=1
MDIMNETALSFTSRDAQVPFKPQVSDPVNGWATEAPKPARLLVRIKSRREEPMWIND